MILNMHNTGLIIGKFCPPHLGHKYLIDTASTEAKKVTVLLCVSALDSIPVEERLKWLRALHPQVTFLILNTDVIERQNAEAWITATRELMSFTPDCIFSSEDYGILYAELMGCEHRMVDRFRTHYPCSARQILECPDQYLQFISPPVASYLLTHS
jgi:cytidyltransferase-like protein